MCSDSIWNYQHRDHEIFVNNRKKISLILRSINVIHAFHIFYFTHSMKFRFTFLSNINQCPVHLKMKTRKKSRKGEKGKGERQMWRVRKRSRGGEGKRNKGETDSLIQVSTLVMMSKIDSLFNVSRVAGPCSLENR